MRLKKHTFSFEESTLLQVIILTQFHLICAFQPIRFHIYSFPVNGLQVVVSLRWWVPYDLIKSGFHENKMLQRQLSEISNQLNKRYKSQQKNSLFNMYSMAVFLWVDDAKSFQSSKDEENIVENMFYFSTCTQFPQFAKNS